MRDEERRENRSGRRASDRAAGAPAWLRIAGLVLALIAAGYALMASREVSRPTREISRLEAENLNIVGADAEKIVDDAIKACGPA